MNSDPAAISPVQLRYRRRCQRDEQRQDRREEEDLSDARHLGVLGEQVHEQAADECGNEEVCKHAPIVDADRSRFKTDVGCKLLHVSARYVAVIVEDLHGRVLLLLRGPTAPHLPNRWNLPGGKIEPGESVAEAAMRETREETALRVYTLSPLARIGDLAVLRADDWAGRVRLVDREHTRASWVPREIAWTWDLIPPQGEVLRRFAVG
jgi:8-oxo-dGTP pyrophosphatase MutT (NUDIX family)